MDHVPVPTAGALAARAVLFAQTTWSGPAFATVGVASKEISTSSVLSGHEPLAIVQRSTYVVPAVPLNTDAGSLGDTTVPPAPEIIDQVPVPMIGVFAASDVV